MAILARIANIDQNGPIRCLILPWLCRIGPKGPIGPFLVKKGQIRCLFPLGTTKRAMLALLMSLSLPDMYTHYTPWPPSPTTLAGTPRVWPRLVPTCTWARVANSRTGLDRVYSQRANLALRARLPPVPGEQGNACRSPLEAPLGACRGLRGQPFSQTGYSGQFSQFGPV